MNPSTKTNLTTVTPFSKLLAAALFITLPFVGVYIGYTFAPEKVVEVIVEKRSDKQTESPGSADQADSLADSFMVTADYLESTMSSKINDSFGDWTLVSTSSNSSGYNRVAHFLYSGDPIEGKLKILYTVEGGGGLITRFVPNDLEMALPDIEHAHGDILWSINAVDVFFNQGTTESVLSDLCGNDCLLDVSDGLNGTVKEYDVLIYPYELKRNYFVVGRGFENLSLEGIRLVE